MQASVSARRDSCGVIRDALELLHQPGDVFEVRALKLGRVKTASGYFNDFSQAAEAIATCDDRRAAGVYVTLNPCQPALLARASNRMHDWPDVTTADNEILKRRWLFIDIDPIRPSGIGACAEEREAAREMAADIEELLRMRGWPYPLTADSGNGHYLLYRIDLANDDATASLIKSFYSGLERIIGARSVAQLDTSVYNAARIIRIGGTTNRKGDDTSERPHRECRFYDPIEECPVTEVPRELIDEIAQQGIESTRLSSGLVDVCRLDVPTYLQAHDVAHKTKPVDGGTAYLVPCPFDEQHGKRGETALVQADSGLLTFDCKHNSCSDRQWHDFRDTVGTPRAEHWLAPGMLGTAGDPEQSEQLERPRFADLIDSRQLLGLDLRVRFLVKDVVVAGQPAVIGARSKGMKTSIATDLVVSLGSGTPFLGVFPAKRCRVAFLSGESGAATIRDTATRIARARQIDLADTSVLWSFELPKLTRPDHLQVLADLITEHSLDVMIIDPLYLSLLSAELANSAGNLYAMGAALAPLSEIGQATGATIMVLHHFRKSGIPDPDEPAALEELSQSGVAEWARQWILLQRREPYRADGTHKLWMRCGGSAGHAGLYAVDIDEGLFDAETLGGRHWETVVRPASDVRAEVRREKEQRKLQDLEQREDDDRRKMLEAIRQAPRETKSVLRELAGLNNSRAGKALCSLLGDKQIEIVDVQKHTRMEKGYQCLAS